MTIGELKTELSSLFGIELEQLVVKKNAQQGELKGMSAKLSELGIIDGDLIKVERGIPHEEETFEIRACLV